MGLCGSSVRGPITIRSFSPVDHKDTNTPQHAKPDKQFLYFVPFCSCVFLAKKSDGVWDVRLGGSLGDASRVGTMVICFKKA